MPLHEKVDPRSLRGRAGKPKSNDAAPVERFRECETDGCGDQGARRKGRVTVACDGVSRVFCSWPCVSYYAIRREVTG